MILPKLYQCIIGKGDSVNLFQASGTQSNKASVVKEGHISGLGNVSHIDRSSLTADMTTEKRGSDGGESQRKSSMGDIAERDDEFNDN